MVFSQGENRVFRNDLPFSKVFPRVSKPKWNHLTGKPRQAGKESNALTQKQFTLWSPITRDIYFPYTVTESCPFDMELKPVSHNTGNSILQDLNLPERTKVCDKIFQRSANFTEERENIPLGNRLTLNDCPSKGLQSEGGRRNLKVSSSLVSRSSLVFRSLNNTLDVNRLTFRMAQLIESLPKKSTRCVFRCGILHTSVAPEVFSEHTLLRLFTSTDVFYGLRFDSLALEEFEENI
ncbi:hypothetical protein CLF_111017 [Clonorchis sinensis]|uniref:Uncharacterized protein n=1 Tax=Clonorchis sinensis TaxID=79923 RepID=G7YU76_CLOSI|nr:hypothetical protein CLF_111017 [Clonorchis sinensis]